MIKKKLMALGVSAAAITAVAGAGFAGWFFDDETAANANLGVHITAAYEIGAVAIDTAAPDKVLLDQAGVTLVKGEAYTTAIDKVEAKWTVTTVAYNAASWEYEVTVYVADALDTYVNCTGDTNSEVTKTGYGVYTYTATASVTTSGDNTVVTISCPLAFDYDNTNKPTDIGTYKTMVNSIGNKTDAAADTAYDIPASGATSPVIVEFKVKRVVPAA